MKFFYFVSLIASALYLLAFLPKLRTRREPIAYWGVLDLSGRQRHFLGRLWCHALHLMSFFKQSGKQGRLGHYPAD